MEQYLNESDCMKLEMKELELLLGPEDSEVNLRRILRNASRRGGRLFEIFSLKEKSEHLVASKVRWDERQRLMAVQEEKSKEGTCKKLTMRSIKIGQRPVIGLKQNVQVFWRIANT